MSGNGFQKGFGADSCNIQVGNRKKPNKLPIDNISTTDFEGRFG